MADSHNNAPSEPRFPWGDVALSTWAGIGLVAAIVIGPRWIAVICAAAMTFCLIAADVRKHLADKLIGFHEETIDHQIEFIDHLRARVDFWEGTDA